MLDARESGKPYFRMARSKHVSYLLIGGGPASARAVQAIRRRDRRGRIVIVGEERWWPYDRPPLSKGMILGSPQPHEIRSERRRYHWKHRAVVKRGVRVERLALGSSPPRAYLSDGSSTTFDKALLATGGVPRRLGLPGEELGGVHVLRTADDAVAVASAARSAQRAVIVGAGFIGLELAAFLRQAGCEVTIVEAKSEAWGEFAPTELRAFLRKRVELLGVQFLFGTVAAEIERMEHTVSGRSSDADLDHSDERASGVRAGVAAVRASTGERIPCELVCVAVGNEPRDRVAREAGIEIGEAQARACGPGARPTPQSVELQSVEAQSPALEGTAQKDSAPQGGGVLVDSRMQTSDPRVFAAGDVALFRDPYSGRLRRAEHYCSAEYGGLVAGENMAGGGAEWEMVPYFWSDIGDLTVEVYGDEAAWDEILTREFHDEPEDDPKITLLGLKDGRLICSFSVNAPEQERSALQVLIRKQTALQEYRGLLCDAAVPLATVVQKAVAGG